MSETIKITVNIAGKNYPLLIDPSEEELIRKMESNLKTKYLSVTNEYPKLETKDHLAMILMELGMDNLKNEQADNEVVSMEKVDNIISKIENSLI